MRKTAISGGAHLRRYAPRRRRPGTFSWQSLSALILTVLAAMVLVAIPLAIIITAATSSSQEAALFAQKASARSELTVTTGPAYYSRRGPYNITVPTGSILYTNQALAIHALTGSTVYVQKSCVVPGWLPAGSSQRCAQVYAQTGARVYVEDSAGAVPPSCWRNGGTCNWSGPVVYSEGAVVSADGYAMVFPNDHSVVYAYGHSYVQGWDSTVYASGQSTTNVVHSVVYAYGSAYVTVRNNSTVVAYGSDKPVGIAPEVAPQDCSSHIYANFGAVVNLTYGIFDDFIPGTGNLAVHCAPDIHLSYGAILVVVAVAKHYASVQVLWCHGATTFKTYKSVCNTKEIRGDKAPPSY